MGHRKKLKKEKEYAEILSIILLMQWSPITLITYKPYQTFNFKNRNKMIFSATIIQTSGLHSFHFQLVVCDNTEGKQTICIGSKLKGREITTT